jgi:PadR family transcriptional regulator, regulatory protein PadR
MTENLSFDDILDDLMMEEDQPTPEALARWQERYPQYRQDLAEFFETWAEQESMSHLPKPQIDEEMILKKSVEYGMEILRKQGRLMPDTVPALTPYDELVLTAIYLLGGKGYPATITLKVAEMSETEPLPGSVYVSLNRLETQGLALSRPANPETEPENKTRRYFTVTMSGDRALAYAKETSAVVARYLPDFA